jgi:diguanylate cyclase (GGDEF)-like protein/PAS domain S-box-containing protein
MPKFSGTQKLLILLIAIFTLGIASVINISSQYNEDKAVFESKTQALHQLHNLNQKRTETLLDALSEYYTAQVVKSQNDFRLFAKGLLGENIDNQTIGLAKLIPRSQKEQIELAQYSRGYESFKITDSGLFKEQKPNLKQAFLTIITITPLDPKNSIYLSEDLFSIPEMVSKFAAATQTNQPQTLTLTEARSGRLQQLSFQPIFLTSPSQLSHEQRLKQVRGVAFLIQPVEETMLQQVSQFFPLEDISIRFTSSSDKETQVFSELTDQHNHNLIDKILNLTFHFDMPINNSASQPQLEISQHWCIKNIDLVSLGITLLLTLLGYFVVTALILTMVHYTRNLQQMQNRLSQILGTSQDAVIITNEKGYILDWNPGAERIFHFKKEEAQGHPIVSLIFTNKEISPDLPKNAHVLIQKFTKTFHLSTLKGKTQKSEAILYNKFGDEIITEISRAFLNVNGKIEISLFIKDITYQRQTERAIKKMAYFDALTQLENRSYFKESIDKIIHDHPEKKFALFFMDLDGFKQVNDTLGHSVGDELLKVIAKRIQGTLREGKDHNHICRFGGDEFVLMVDGMDESKSSHISLRLLNQIQRMIKIEQDELQVSASIGIAIYPEHGIDVDTLLRHADTAMYHSKELGKNTYSIYNNAMEENLEERILIEKHLRNAIKKNEFFLVYQPQINLKTGRIIGVEALIRWRNPVLGFVPPDKFIPIAEDSQLIIHIGEWVTQTCIAQLQAWKNTPFSNLHIAMNVSSVQFENPHFLDFVNKMMSNAQIHNHLLEIELTERTVMNNVDSNIHRFNQIRANGFGLSVDDFGTGYSSLSYLKKFPLSILKIDKSFVDGIPTEEEDISIATAILNLAHSLNIQVVAEGVETVEQLQYLQSLQCDFVQGYYVSRPLPVKDLEDWLTNNNANFFDTNPMPPIKQTHE